ncbi:MAG: PmoA family protein [Roseibacillus sp.]|nr:PmoA family protein [Roseibacillus sp.]
MNTTALTTLLLAAGITSSLAAPVEIKDIEGKHLDVVVHGKTVVRYMYENDISSEARHHETYKPYLHVFDAEGKKPITKGAGGKFTHHRGIFLGWNKLQFNGKSYDRWHMKGGDIVHQKFTKKEVAGHGATFTSVTHWNDAEKKPLLDEERTMSVQEVHGGGVRLVIEFQSKLTATYGDVFLKGDPEHAGIQYRPANEVDTKKTKYTFPEGVSDVKKARDLPWIGETYVLDGKTYSVVQMNHLGNPKGTKHSAYRDYGRFGSFFEKEIKKGESLTVNYQFVIVDGELPDPAKIQKAWVAYSKMK